MYTLTFFIKKQVTLHKKEFVLKIYYVKKNISKSHAFATQTDFRSMWQI